MAETKSASRRELHATHPYLVLAIVLSAAFMQLLDVSIVNVAVPSIQRELGASYSDVQFVLIGFQLAFAALLITASRLGDLLDRRRIFLLGMAGFTLASALCGASIGPGMLIGSRVLQGLFGALMFSQVLAFIQVVFPPRERGKAFAVFGATIGIATILGPLVGGALIQWNLAGLDWRTIFYVNVPIGVLGLAVGLRALPSSRSEHAQGLDIPGMLLSTVGLLLLVYPITVGREKGWPAWLILMGLASLPVLAVFVVYERRLTLRGRSPLMPTTLFHDRAFTAGLALGLVFFAGLPAFFFSISIYLQIGFGYTALHAGLTIFPFAVGSGLASAASDRLARRIGRSVLMLGVVILGVDMAVLIWLVQDVGVNLVSWKLWPVLFVGGLGLGAFVAPLLNLVLADVRPSNVGPASGLLPTSQQVGGAIGVALVSVTLFSLLGSNASWAVNQTTPVLRSGLAAAGLPAPATEAVINGFGTCFTDRVTQSDPTATPASCAALEQQASSAGPAGAKVAKLMQDTAAPTALRHDFARSFADSLYLQIALWVVSGLLVLLLPKGAPDSHHGPGPEAEPAIAAG